MCRINESVSEGNCGFEILQVYEKKKMREKPFFIVVFLRPLLPFLLQTNIHIEFIAEQDLNASQAGISILNYNSKAVDICIKVASG